MTGARFREGEVMKCTASPEEAEPVAAKESSRRRVDSSLHCTSFCCGRGEVKRSFAASPPLEHKRTPMGAELIRDAPLSGA